MVSTAVASLAWRRLSIISSSLAFERIELLLQESEAIVDIFESAAETKLVILAVLYHDYCLATVMDLTDRLGGELV